MVLQVITLLTLMVAILLVVALLKLQSELKANQIPLSEDREEFPVKEVLPVSVEQLDNSELEAQLKSKTIELAKTAKNNNDLRDLLQEVKESIEELRNHPKSLARVSKRILAQIDSAVKPSENTFEIQLDELHEDFFKRFKLKHEDLTIHDLRLGVYIKLGMNAKEIAELQNIKPSSVYISRSRLRKKLGLDPEDDLLGYLNSV